MKQAALSERVRKAVGRTAIDYFFRMTSRAGRALPMSNPGRHGVEMVRDVPYLPDGQTEHLLDIYRPAGATGPLPVVLYVHGGGFRILSKESHWLFALQFARRGYLTFNVNYRLAPEHPYPAAVEDACAAYQWVVKNAGDYGGDVERLILAGESAGANLVTGLTLAACNERPEPYARAVFDTGVVPRVVLPLCGIFQVSNVERFATPELGRLVLDRLEEVSGFYLDEADPETSLDLADPVVTLERGGPFARPLPPFFMSVGTADVLISETRRLEDALTALGVPAEARYYTGGMHAFQAFVWLKKARQSWTDAFAFIDQHL